MLDGVPTTHILTIPSGALLIVMIFVSLLTAGAIAANGAPGPITQAQSGLVAQDALVSGNLTHWVLYGDAIQEKAPYTYSEDAQGLHLGVQALAAGSWAGYFAKSPNTYATVFHAVLKLPYTSIPSNSFNTGMYVQTSTSHLNYVACLGHVNATGYYWLVLYSSGSALSVTTFHRLYIQRGGPVTMDCTLVTNGLNTLKAYFDGQLVYSSSALDLQMPSPFNSYLEVESAYAGAMLYGSYSDYYALAGDTITVQNAIPGGSAHIIDSKSNVIANATIGSDGSGLLDVGEYHEPLWGTIQVFDASHTLVASSVASGTVWGGDVYKVSALTTTSSSSSSSLTTTSSSSATTSTSSSVTTRGTAITTSSSSQGGFGLVITAQDSLGDKLTGPITLFALNGQPTATANAPHTFSLNSGQVYEVQIGDSKTCRFDRWMDTGDSSRLRIVVATGGTMSRLIAIYNCTVASSYPPQTGHADANITDLSSDPTTSASLSTTTPSATDISSASPSMSYSSSSSSSTTESTTMTQPLQSSQITTVDPPGAAAVGVSQPNRSILPELTLFFVVVVIACIAPILLIFGGRKVDSS